MDRRTFVTGSAVALVTGLNAGAADAADAAPLGPPPLDLNAALGRVDLAVNSYAVPDHYVWCGTPIEVDGHYYLFHSRWPTGSTGRGTASSERMFDGFSGWMKYSEVAVAESDSPLGPFRHVTTVLRGTGDADRWDRFNAHNPHIRRFDGRYYLYYIATRPTAGETWDSYHAGQRIGVLVADSFEDLLAGKGRRSAAPIAAPDGRNTFRMAVNPSVDQRPDGSCLMTFKAWDSRQRYITVVGTAPRPEGPFTFAGTALGSTQTQAEDPYLWYDAPRGQYFAIVKDFYKGTNRTGALTSQEGALALVQSPDGTNWSRAQHTLVSLKQLTLQDGTVMKLGNLERPQLLLDPATATPTVLFAAIRGSGIALSRNVAIPLSVPAVDLALGRPTRASSSRMAGREASLAVDGDPSTRWGSRYADPEWWEVDLGTDRDVTAVELAWENAYASSYRIQLSADRSQWTDLVVNTEGRGGTERLDGLAGRGRWLRMLGQRRGTQYGYSLWRVSVYGR